MVHIEELEARIARFDAELLRSLRDAGYGVPLQLLQTLPGIDLMGAAMLLVEIGADMKCVWQCAASGVLGGHVSGQQRVRRQA